MEIESSLPAPAPGALPAVRNEFVGREAELEEARCLLADPATRLLTLNGPGGVGKTRLALEIAHAAETFFDGTLYVPLAAVDDAARVIPATARAAGIVDMEERLAGRLRERLADRRTLLVLDNLEHLAPEAAAPITWLLDAAPGSTVLATSRRALRIAAEQIILVEPLSVETAGADAPMSEAARLYVARARAAYPAFRLGEGDGLAIEAICARLDGLPLAIELAAGRSRVFSPKALLARLEQRLPQLSGRTFDGDPRHQTMRDAVAWSYDLLGSEEQALFRRLAVFAGGAVVERIAAGREVGGGYPFADGYGFNGHPEEALFDGESSATHAADYPSAVLQLPVAAIATDPIAGLETLLDHQLLMRGGGTDGEPRFTMLETVREFGLERLAADGEDAAVRHAHAAIMVAFAEATYGIWASMRVQSGLDRIDDELPNVFSALRWADAQGVAGAELVLRIAEPLLPYWQWRGRLTEGRAWLQRGLAHVPAGLPEWIVGLAWVNGGVLAWMQGDDKTARDWLEAGLALGQRRDWPNIRSRAHIGFALLEWRRGADGVPAVVGHLAGARASHQLWPRGSEIGRGICALLEGMLARAAAEPRAARSFFEEAFALHEATGYVWGTATARYLAGEAAREEGKLAEAIPLLKDGLQRYAALGDSWGSGAVVSAAACVAADRGELATSARLFGAAAEMLNKIDAFLPPTDLGTYALTRDSVAARLGAKPFATAFQAGAERSMAAALADALNALDQAGAPPVSSDPFAGLTAKQRAMLREILTRYPGGKGFTVKGFAHARGRGQSATYDMLAGIAKQLGLPHWEALLSFVTAHEADLCDRTQSPET